MPDTFLVILHTCIPSSLQCFEVGDISIAIFKMADIEAQFAQVLNPVYLPLEFLAVNDIFSTLDQSPQFLTSPCCH